MGNQIIEAQMQARPLDPSKDLAAYGYGSVAWKERMEMWKQKQEKLHSMRKGKHNNSTEDHKHIFPDDDDSEFPL